MCSERTVMDPYQNAKAMSVEGHNIVITGQAGSGKSQLVREMFKQLTSTGKVVQLTASTGLAASLLPGSIYIYCNRYFVNKVK